MQIEEEIANLHECEITVRQGKRTTYYHPHIVPVADEKTVPSNTADERPGVSIANARGEVLSPWGDVLEVIPC